jgi:hypothetical protein
MIIGSNRNDNGESMVTAPTLAGGTRDARRPKNGTPRRARADVARGKAAPGCTPTHGLSMADSSEPPGKGFYSPPCMGARL